MESESTEIGSRIKPSVEKLWQRFYPNYKSSWFRDHVASHLTPDAEILEIGAGSGVGQQSFFDFRGKVSRYVGIDIDRRVVDNPHLDEGYEADTANLPFPDKSFDLVFHTMVAEHLADPLAATAEAVRVLRDDGLILFQTPNRFYYPMLLAAITPHWVHTALVNRLASGRHSEDVFPTFYLLNDQKSIEQAFDATGTKADIDYRALPPGYLRFSRASFLLGVAYERTVERFVPKLRALILVSARKRVTE